MVGKIDLDNAIMDATGSAAVMSVLRDALLTHDGQQWDRILATPREGMAVVVFTDEEWRAVNHALASLLADVERVGREFYAACAARAI